MATAAALNRVLHMKGSRNTIEAVVEELIPWFKGDNPNFDPKRFKEAVFHGYQ